MDLKEHFSSLTSKDILAWFHSKENGLDKKTHQYYLYILTLFCYFCVEEKHLERAPFLLRKNAEYWELKKPLPNKGNKQVINEYLLDLKLADHNKRTIQEKRNFLQIFFSQQTKSFSLITWDDISAHFETNYSSLSKNTYQGYLSKLSCFYRYCERKGYIEWSPMIRQWFFQPKEGEQKEEKYWELKKPFLNIENAKAISEFLLSLKLANRSRGTINLYRQYLERVFANQIKTFSSLSSEEILAYFQEHESHLKESTYKSHLTILSSFYNFCIQEELVDRSVIKNRWYPRLPKTLPKALGKEEIAKLRKESENYPLRDQLLFEFLLTSGCRVGEVNRLNIEDLDLENRIARIIGKGKKIRSVHFTERCKILMERYLRTRPKVVIPVFLGNDERRIGIARIQSIINEMGRKAGLSTRIYPHRLRHTFATELLTKGADISFIAEELGHSDIQTTQIYARVPNQDLINQYRRFMG